MTQRLGGYQPKAVLFGYIFEFYSGHLINNDLHRLKKNDFHR